MTRRAVDYPVMRVLVTGGAGYIGSHAVRALQQRGDEVVVVDDLSSGNPARVAQATLVRENLAAPRAAHHVAAAVSQGVDAVIHFAALKSVPESIRDPRRYFGVNVGATAAALDVARLLDAKTFVLSSSAAVYGDVNGVVSETHACAPINPYGASKLASEALVAAATAAGAVTGVSLRYFNVAGAVSADLGDRVVANVATVTMDRVSRGLAPQVYGGDYPTSDGTCVRDYVHVQDVVEAHLAVLDRATDDAFPAALNIGTGVGTSVLALVTRLADAMGSSARPEVTARREGDPAVSVARVSKIADHAGWRARFSMEDIVESAVAAFTQPR